MINDLQINTPLYKYVDDCSTYEIVSRSFPNSSLQANINTINDCTNHNNMRLNVSKTKEMRISFLRVPMEFDALSSSGLNIEIVQTFKLLGVKSDDIIGPYQPRTQALCVVLWLAWPLRGPRGSI